MRNIHEKTDKMSAKQTNQGTLSDRLTIPVRKYDPEVFRMIILFIHCGTAIISDKTVSGKFVLKFIY